LPGPEDIFGASDQLAGEQVICGALGEPRGQARPSSVVKGLPAQVLPNALELLGLRRQTAGELPKEHQGQVQLPGKIVCNGDRGRGGLRQKAAIGPQRTELDGKAAAVRLSPATEDFHAVTVRKRPGLEKLLVARIVREDDERCMATHGHDSPPLVTGDLQRPGRKLYFVARRKHREKAMENAGLGVRILGGFLARIPPDEGRALRQSLHA
jgi:hypothetical protein